MKILAIDPGFDRMGMAIIQKEDRGREKLLFSECFSPTKNIPREKRILQIGKKINTSIKKWGPQALVIENLFFGKNHKTALSVAETIGVIIYEAGLSDIPIHHFTPLQVKMAITGNGRSDKRQIGFMLGKLIDLKGKKAKTDDEDDAIALGLTFFAYKNSLVKKSVSQ